tara:strand:- start:3647 stop:5740 length:2094 start_codon:yes stop_codon:yes gene_type:complete
MADSFYNEALDLLALNEIEESVNKQNSITINTLFDKAIINAQIIENNFYETKYIDDAYYIIGMSTFYQNKISSSKYYFERIYNEYSSDDFFYKSIIMLSKLSLKMEDIENYNLYISKIDIDKLNKNEKVMFYLTLVDYNNYKQNPNEVFKNSLLAIENLDTKTQKIPIYYNLLILAENNDNYTDAIKYINQIEYCLDNKKVNNDLLDKWIKYNTNLNEFTLISEKLNDYIQTEINEKKKVSYLLKLVENYMNSQDYSKARNKLNDLLEQYKDNRSLKSEVSQIYYLLGIIELESYNDFDRSRFFFQESIDISRVSEFGKKSDSKIKVLNEINDLQELIENSSQDSIHSTIIIDEDRNKRYSINMSLDSLLYSYAQILFYDLNLQELGLQNFNEIINKFPDSDYGYKSRIILNLENKEANIPMLTEVSVNVDNQLSKLDTLIDESWSLFVTSREQSMKNFKNLYQNYKDEKSLYIIGTIYDKYEKNIDSTVYYYNNYLDAYPNGSYGMEISDRLNEIKDMLDYNISYLNQKIYYKKAMGFFDNNYDSSLHYFDLSSMGRDREIKNFSKNNLSILRQYHINDSLLKINYDNIDSVRINKASILYKDLGYDSLAITIYKDIINNSKDMSNINSSLSAMSNILEGSKWDSLLFVNVQDSNLFKLLIDKSKRNNMYLIKDSLEQNILDLKFYNEKYKLFINN